MPIIIDGWNFIRNGNSSIEDDFGCGKSSAEELMAHLSDFQSAHNDPIVVVFDSKSEHLDIRYTKTAKLKAIAVRDADNYIKSCIEKVPERERRNLRVVSSDNGVYYYARSAYATPLKSEEFWDKINRW